MKTWQLQDFNLESLKTEEKSNPKIINKNDVLIKIKAASLNYRDIIMISGGYGKMGGVPPFVPISDGAGIIEEIGKDVKKFKKGDKVILPFFKNWNSGNINDLTALSALGGIEDGVMQELMVFSEDKVVKAPDGWTSVESCTLPCAAVTAWRTIVTEGGVTKDSTVLVQGLGGVSIFAIQIAKLFNAKVIATTSSPQRMIIAKNIGADEVVNYNVHVEWWKKVQELTSRKGVDIIVEVGGGNTLEQSIKASKTGAVIGIIGVLSGGTAQLPIGRAIAKSSRLIGITCGNQEDLTDLCLKLDHSNSKPVIDSIYGFDKLPEALSYMKQGKHLGKIVIDFEK
jgi:NADPH:quinone reductase-like Zn-dependent oxidoreductase|tara:strand:- start:91 stop:1110 length:1020 start_codon:yes stop_codon:yes gene_type:complete